MSTRRDFITNTGKAMVAGGLVTLAENGKIPNPHAYSNQIQQAKTNRLTENKKFKCCHHSF